MVARFFGLVSIGSRRFMENTSIESELKSLLSKLTVEIEDDSKEIELRRKRIQKNEELVRALRASLGARQPQGNGIAYGRKSEMIWDAIMQIQTGQFTQDEVESELKRMNPQVEINRTRIRTA